MHPTRSVSLRRTRGQGGSAIFIVMLMLVPICAILGIAADGGWSYYIQQTEHAAAESAAIAAVRSTMDFVYAGASYSCSSSVVCGTQTCPSTNVASVTYNLQSGCDYAIANGFTSGVSIQGSRANPVNGIQVLYSVTVTITKSNHLTFLGVLGPQFVGVSAHSTAAVIDKAPASCVIALDGSANPSFSVSGTSSLTLTNCGLQVDSNASGALTVNGGGCIAATYISVVGGISNGGCAFNTMPIVGANVAPDPFAGLAAPSFSGSCDYNNAKVNGNATVTLSPGTYCGGITVASGTVTMNPGTYILLGGGLTCNANCNLVGSGVTFYNTFNSSKAYGNVSINGSGNVNLTAPTSGSLAGVLFFQDRAVSLGQSETINGGSNTSFSGTIYFPRSTVNFSGTASDTNSSTFLVANKVALSGNAHLQISSTGPVPAWAPVAALIE